LRRKGNHEVVERLRIDRTRPLLRELCRKAARWALDHAKELCEADPDLPRLGSDRAEDNWRSLVAIADVAGGRWPSLAREAAETFTHAESDDSDAPAELLLADLQTLFFKEKGVERLASKEICEALADLEDRPWGEWQAGKPITTNGLARMLKGFEVRPKTIKLANGSTSKGYLLSDFEDSFSRYPAKPPIQTVIAVTDLKSKENSDFQTVTNKALFSPTVTRQVTEKQCELLEGYGVTVELAQIRAEKKKIHVIDETKHLPDDMEVI
jgi:putative DNA primase/helicase